MASQLLGNVGTDGNGLSGLEYRLDDAPARPRRRAPARPRRARRHDRAARGRSARSPAQDVRLTLDAQHPGPHRGGARRGRRDVAAQGRDGARHGPARRRDPRARELAARERQQAPRGARLRDDQPRDRRHLRAGLDVQGVHRRRRARGRQGHADDAVHAAAGAPGRRPRDHRLARRAAGRRATSPASSRSPPTSARR